MIKSLGLICLGCIGVVFTLNADEQPQHLTDSQILAKVTYPSDFTASVFASPPDIRYPIFLSAAADGTLFIGCDENGSLDTVVGRGRVIMARDTKGTGKADTFTTFAKMDSPRGVAWDPSTRTLYVMHPPFLTAYHDDNNTGVANRQEDLISGLGFDLSFRGADHTINGIRLGIDGWIYIACGDYGAVKATGKDGRSFSLRGGGIVRIRPDGTGMELVAHGTRNILSVAVSPTLDLFVRDNTNDGDDWNDRLSYVPMSAEMGYPTLFRNFADEMIPALYDFGGGSPVGSIFLDEPLLPEQWARGFYSVEWGRNEIVKHTMTPQGGTFSVKTTPFMKMVRATDLETDGVGHLYAASWDGATFTYVGPNVGYVIQLTPKNAKVVYAPQFKALKDSELVALVSSNSAVYRLAAQRELLVRKINPEVVDGLQKLMSSSASAAVKVASIFTLKQMLGINSHKVLISYLADPSLREYILKALADDTDVATEVSAEPFIASLNDSNARVRSQAVIGLGRLGKLEAAPQLLLRTADSDYTVAHLAVQALRRLKASDVCLAAIDQNDARIRRGAFLVLQSLYEPKVVDALIARLPHAEGKLKDGIFNALARLDMKEAPYVDPKMWWNTRPDTSGPVYKPVRWEASDAIELALKKQLAEGVGSEGKFYVKTLLATKVTFPGATTLMLDKAGNDASSRLDLIEPMLSPKTPAAKELMDALALIAHDSKQTVLVRARALRFMISQLDKNQKIVIPTLVELTSGDKPAALSSLWNEVTHDSRMARRLKEYTEYAYSTDPLFRTLGTTVLVNIVENPVIKNDKAKIAAKKTAHALLDTKVGALTLLDAIARTHAADFADIVKSQLGSSDADIAASAGIAYKALHLDETQSGVSQLISDLPYEEVVRRVVAIKGDPKRGQEMFMQHACFVCHTLTPHDPAKGPMLGGIRERYSRADIVEAVLKPSAKIAQGFESQFFKVKNNGETIEGFVIKEGGDSVEVRNIGGVTTVIEKGDIVERGKRTASIMPEGLFKAGTTEDLASLISYLETTSAQ